MADKNDMYVVHGAKTMCSVGLRESKLVLQKDHGIFIRSKPQMTVKDCQANKNVICFGGCISMENPETLTKSQGISAGIVTGGAAGAFCRPVAVAASGCAGMCTPVILSSEWENGKDDTEIDGEKALLGSGTLTCLYGGIITIEDVGQE